MKSHIFLSIFLFFVSQHSSLAITVWNNPFSGKNYEIISMGSVFSAGSIPFKKALELKYVFPGKDFTDTKEISKEALDIILGVSGKANESKSDGIIIKAVRRESSEAVLGAVDVTHNQEFGSVFFKSHAGSWIAKDEKDLGPNVFSAKYLGFQIEKPAGWNFIEPRVKGILLNLEKHKEPYDGLNSSVEIFMLPLAESKVELTSKVFLEQISALAKQLNVKNIPKPASTKIKGDIWLHTEFSGSVQAGSESFPVLVKVWRTTHNGLIFGLNLTGPPSGPDSSNKEFDQIKGSILLF